MLLTYAAADIIVKLFRYAADSPQRKRELSGPIGVDYDVADPVHYFARAFLVGIQSHAAPNFRHAVSAPHL